MDCSLTRREMLRGLSGCLVAGLLSSAAPSTAPPNIRWAQGYLLWRNFKGRTLTLKDALADLKAVGADGIEFSPQASELEQQGLTPDALKTLLKQAGLSVSGNYFSAPFYDPSRKEEILREAASRFALLREFGAKNLIIGPPGGKETDSGRAQLIRQAAAVLNELGRRAVDQGLQIGLHPHLNTLIETPAEIDLAMEATDPRYVGLAADTGHIYLAGGDLLAVLGKYQSRLNYFHFKDGVRPFARPDFKPNLRELGKGEVDFPAVMRLLKKMRYRGWINIEQDATRLTPQESATISMAYVTQTLKPIYA